MEQKNRTILIVSLLGLIVVVPLVLALYTWMSRIGTVEITIAKAPNDAKLIVGDVVVGGTTAHLKPGTYRYSATKDGFGSQEGVIEVKKYGDPPSIIAILEPQTDSAREWYDKNQNQFFAAEAVAGEVARKKGLAQQDAQPIISLLPYSNMLYTIGYKSDPADASGDSIILTVDAPDVYRDAAITQIYNWGYDPVNYKIEIKDERNPFAP